MEILDLVVLSAGQGTRVGSLVPKQFMTLADKPVIIHGIEVFERLPYIGTKYVVCAHDQMGQMREVLSEYGISNWVLVEGGEVRSASVRHGLAQVRTERVITHNAVMPLVTERLVNQVVTEDYDCVTTVTPLEHNLCEGEDFGANIVPRRGLKLINTPQSFRTQIFRDCHEKAAREGYIPASDCELMLHYGCQVRFVPGIPENFKITVPLDLIIAEAILKSRAPVSGRRQTPADVTWAARRSRYAGRIENVAAPKQSQ